MRQPTRLEAGWDKKCVGACLNPVCERFIIADEDANPPREGLSRRAEAGFDLGITLAKDGELHIFFEEDRKIIEQQVEPLLPGEPADNA